MQSREPVVERIKRFARSAVVGIVATIADFAVLGLCVGLLRMPDWVGKVFSLSAGTSIQFIGSRHYAFRAQRGRLGRQLKWFVLAEAFAFVLTVVVFRVLVRYLQVPIVVANLLSGSIVYFGFSYPIWKWVFRVLPSELSPAAGDVTVDVEMDKEAA